MAERIPRRGERDRVRRSASEGRYVDRSEGIVGRVIVTQKIARTALMRPIRSAPSFGPAAPHVSRADDHIGRGGASRSTGEKCQNSSSLTRGTSENGYLAIEAEDEDATKRKYLDGDYLAEVDLCLVSAHP